MEKELAESLKDRHGFIVFGPPVEVNDSEVRKVSEKIIELGYTNLRIESFYTFPLQNGGQCSVFVFPVNCWFRSGDFFRDFSSNSPFKASKIDILSAFIKDFFKN